VHAGVAAERGSPPSRGRHGHAPARAGGGFTLIELLIALVLMALLSALLFGSLRVAGKSADAGDAKAEATASMRLASDFLRTEIEEQHPQRMKRIAEFPLLFNGTPDELEFAAPVPSRIQGGGVWLYRLRVASDGNTSKLVLDRMVPDVNAQALPQFAGDDHSVLADNIASVKLQYFGRDDGADASVAPSWRDRWDSRQTLPLEIRIDVTPATGPAWPTIYATPRNAPEAGCRGYDYNRQRCVTA
jgi:general secretion pathway protein J